MSLVLQNTKLKEICVVDGQAGDVPDRATFDKLKFISEIEILHFLRVSSLASRWCL